MSNDRAVPFTPPRGTVPAGTSAWQSMPPFIRFAVWMWSVTVVICIGGAGIVAGIMFLAL